MKTTIKSIAERCVEKVGRVAFPLLMAAAAALVAPACSDDDGDDKKEEQPVINSIRLSQSSAELATGETLRLTAVTDPEGFDVTWATTDANVASVEGGLVTALAEGSATISAAFGGKTAVCDITVKNSDSDTEPNPNPNPAIKGSNFYLFSLDGQTAQGIANDIVADFRPDDQTKFYYIWENTYSAGSCSGLNFFGLADTWVSLKVGGAGWSGAGYSIDDGDLLDKLALINSDEPEKYYFHIAVKGSAPQLIILGQGDGNEGKVAICGDYVDGQVTYHQKGTSVAKGDWTEIEIPMSEFFDAGLAYRTGVKSSNVFSHLSGGVSGTTFEYDACYIYKKAE